MHINYNLIQLILIELQLLYNNTDTKFKRANRKTGIKKRKNV